MNGSAHFSPNGKYRYELRREWNRRLPPLIAIMLNPSKAGSIVNDPTVTRLIHRASRLSCGSLIVGNLGAGVNTSPKLWLKMADPIGPKNDRHLRRILTEARERGGIVFVGWGTHAPDWVVERFQENVEEVTQQDFYCLGVTKDGHPRHPLHVAYETELELWNGYPSSRNASKSKNLS